MLIISDKQHQEKNYRPMRYPA